LAFPNTAESLIDRVISRPSSIRTLPILDHFEHVTTAVPQLARPLAGCTDLQRPLVKQWSVEPSSNPAGATSSTLHGVSCISSSFCTAVGYGYDPTEQALAERWNGTSWTAEPNPAGDSTLYGVSCTSSSSCTAVGSSGEQALAESLVHGSGDRDPQ
jgi:hypothetical protein